MPVVRWDKEANAAYIAFKEVAAGEAARQLEVQDRGQIVAVLDLSASGELLGVELLNARVQLPSSFRD